MCTVQSIFRVTVYLSTLPCDFILLRFEVPVIDVPEPTAESEQGAYSTEKSESTTDDVDERNTATLEEHTSAVEVGKPEDEKHDGEKRPANKLTGNEDEDRRVAPIEKSPGVQEAGPDEESVPVDLLTADSEVPAEISEGLLLDFLLLLICVVLSFVFCFLPENGVFWSKPGLSQKRAFCYISTQTYSRRDNKLVKDVHFVTHMSSD